MTAGFLLGQVLRDLGALLRWRLAAMNGVAALSGTLLFPLPTPLGLAVGVCTGATFLAGGASALNQLQERALDGRMERTRQRPLPAGRLTPGPAATVAALALASGGGIIYWAGGLAPLVVAAAILFCYHGLYTPLKPHTALAIVPGALCGALPPLLGWVAAGGAGSDGRILLLAGLYLLWQLPHVWLFQRRHAADHRHAGLPLLPDLFAAVPQPWLLRLWRCALLAAALLLPAFGLIRPPLALPYAAVLTLLLLFPAPTDHALFRRLHLLPLLIAITLLVQQMLT